MGINIRAFQDAYEKTVSAIKNNSQVVSIIVYGSIISGDIWEKSDIDFLVVTNESKKMENIYSKISGVPIHINYISKDLFIESYNNLLKGGTFHKAVFTGKLVYSEDRDVDDVYLSTRFYMDRDRQIRDIEILCNLLNSIHYTKKYYSTGKIETSFQWCIELLVNYARLLMNAEGHITDKDILSLAVSMNDDVKNLFNVLTGSESLEGKIGIILAAVEKFINSNIKRIATPIIDYLKVSKELCSVQNVKNSDMFKHVDGDLSLVLDKLSELGIINESTRKYTSHGEEQLIDEVVYFSK